MKFISESRKKIKIILKEEKRSSIKKELRKKKNKKDLITSLKGKNLNNEI